MVVDTIKERYRRISEFMDTGSDQIGINMIFCSFLREELCYYYWKNKQIYRIGLSDAELLKYTEDRSWW